MRFIPTRVHGIMDYLMGIVLILAPWLLGFANGGAAMWTPIILGAIILAQALMTDYELGVASVVSMRVHLGMDAIIGILLALSPWMFGFAELVWVPHLIFGLLAFGAAFTTQTVPKRRAELTGRAEPVHTH